MRIRASMTLGKKLAKLATIPPPREYPISVNDDAPVHDRLEEAKAISIAVVKSRAS